MLRLEAAVAGPGMADGPPGGLGSRVGPLGGQPRQAARGKPARICVRIGQAEQPAAACPPHRACRACATAGGPGGQLGSGDRASLPGRSTRYRLVWLVCAHCGTKVPCLFYDERDIPVCGNAAHGPMELAR